jgi:cytochrome P450
MDLSIGTIRTHLFVSLIDHKLVQEFGERQKDGFYRKNGGMHFRSFKQLLGDGLLLSEGEEWRYKRRIMSSLFNYEFIKSKFSMIVSIAKEICDEAKASKQDGKCLIEVNQLFQKIFGTVVIRCFFGEIKLDPI